MGEPQSSLPTWLGWADCSDSDWSPSLPGYQGVNQLNITFLVECLRDIAGLSTNSQASWGNLVLLWRYFGVPLGVSLHTLGAL